MDAHTLALACGFHEKAAAEEDGIIEVDQAVIRAGRVDTLHCGALGRQGQTRSLVLGIDM